MTDRWCNSVCLWSSCTACFSSVHCCVRRCVSRSIQSVGLIEVWRKSSSCFRIFYAAWLHRVSVQHGTRFFGHRAVSCSSWQNEHEMTYIIAYPVCLCDRLHGWGLAREYWRARACQSMTVCLVQGSDWRQLSYRAGLRPWTGQCVAAGRGCRNMWAVRGSWCAWLGRGREGAPEGGLAWGQVSQLPESVTHCTALKARRGVAGMPPPPLFRRSAGWLHARCGWMTDNEGWAELRSVAELVFAISAIVARWPRWCYPCASCFSTCRAVCFRLFAAWSARRILHLLVSRLTGALLWHPLSAIHVRLACSRFHDSVWPALIETRSNQMEKHVCTELTTLPRRPRVDCEAVE